MSILKNYNWSVQALNEPSLFEKETLKNLNKTIEDLYREATYKLDRDFKLYITKEKYSLEGLKVYETELHLGHNTNTTIQVRISRVAGRIKKLGYLNQDKAKEFFTFY